MRIETRVTKLLGIDLPIVQAGMSWASSNSALPLAVSNAGGLGVLAAGPMFPHHLEEAIDEIKAGLKDGSFVIWKGPIMDNTGKELVAKDAVADDKFLGGLKSYVKGVEGKVPGN